MADCDDADPLANPGLPEACDDGDDDDCDGFVDEAPCDPRGGVTLPDGRVVGLDGGRAGAPGSRPEAAGAG